MKKINGIRIIKCGRHEEIGGEDEKTVSRRQIQISAADRVKDWVMDFKAKKQNEIAVARRFFAENTSAANGL